MQSTEAATNAAMRISPEGRGMTTHAAAADRATRPMSAQNLAMIDGYVITVLSVLGIPLMLLMEREMTGFGPELTLIVTSY